MSAKTNTNSSDQWNSEFQRQSDVKQYPKWPNEVMIKTLFGGGNYLERPYKPSPNWRVLDVGCGFANNLIPFADIGCECHGVDLHPQIAETAQKIMNDRGFKIDAQVGSNRSLPYPDAHFDLVLSVNTLHYEGTAENILAALKEFRRVIKPGGALYISTVGPEHEIYRRSELIGDHRYRVKDYDFRNGQEFFFFDTERYLRHYCEEVFDNTETAHVTEKLFKLPLDFLVALCR